MTLLQSDPASELLGILAGELSMAVMAERKGLGIYHSLKNLGQLIGGEYGERVLYELLQNAHDAIREGRSEDVVLKLVIDDADRGDLYVANGGEGLELRNVQAIRNIASSTKEVGEGIGNKGIGFRSVEALTDDPRIYSRTGSGSEPRFGGYCFRFAWQEEIEARVRASGAEDVAAAVAKSMPRYLAAVPVEDQPEAVLEFAREGYATVVWLPLRSSAAVKLAQAQIEELLKSEVPVLLFLDRIRELKLEVQLAGGAVRRKTLTREVETFAESLTELEGCRLEVAVLSPGRRRWLLVRRIVGSERVLDAVERSIAQEPSLVRWREWKGNAVVSLAIPMGGAGLKVGRLYNFLPMGAESPAPLFGHLDAPFFTAINRRRAKLDLPLNAELLDAACEAAAAAGLALARMYPELPARIVVDLVTWSEDESERVESAFETVGTEFGQAEIWPTTQRGWVNIQRLRTWPPGRYKLLRPSEATLSSAVAILSATIDELREEAVRSLAGACGFSIKPSAQDLSAWAEAIAARLPTGGEAVPRDWALFYDELVGFMSTQWLRALAGRKIVLSRDEGVIPASLTVYVKVDGARRSRGGAPLPPREVARRLAVVSSEVSIRPETVVAFERAGLWKRFDAADVLASLPSLFAGPAAPVRRRAALLWAFEVWRHDNVAARKALETAALQVPTRSGWLRADRAAFSGSWTAVGRHLVEYLVEASSHSPACADLSGRLLVDWDDWPGLNSGTKGEWTRFLHDAGVVDGLIPSWTALPKASCSGRAWVGQFAGLKGSAIDKAWRDNNGFKSVWHPQTAYSIRGKAWWLPGQTVVSQLSDAAKKRFAILVLAHLQQSGSEYLRFTLGRFEREARNQDVHNIRTPLATFLMTAAWFPVHSRGEESFVRVADAWLLTDRRSDPRFVPKAPDDVTEYLSSDSKPFEILSKYGLRVWKDPKTAAARVGVLADVCSALEQHERLSW